MTSIGSSAFSGCSGLTTVTLGSGLTSIGQRAFSGCTAVTDVYCYADPEELTWSSAGLYFGYDFKADKATLCHVADASAWPCASSSDKFYKVNVTFVGDLTATSETVVVGEKGVATYCSSFALDFTGLEVTAYIATAFDGSVVTLTPITQVPANTGIILKGAAGSYVVPKGTGSAADENMLVGTTVAKTLSQVEGTNTNFILADGTSGVGFYKVEDNSTLAAHKAYLPLPTASISATPSIGIRFDDATGIRPTLGNDVEESWYDLSGRRIDGQPKAKGIYIMGGRKVVVK